MGREIAITEAKQRIEKDILANDIYNAKLLLNKLTKARENLEYIEKQVELFKKGKDFDKSLLTITLGSNSSVYSKNWSGTTSSSGGNIIFE